MQAIHAEIAELFARLRRVRRQPITPLLSPTVEKPPAADPDALELRVYKLSWSRPPAAASEQPAATQQTTDAEMRYSQQVGEAITALLEPQTWEQRGGQGTLRVIPGNESRVAGMLVVRQTSAVHKQIAKLLRDLDLPAPGGFGGGIFQ
jgi:hypothetical protein